MEADVGLVAASALHAGFQLVVTVLVYPAFRTVPVELWAAQHGRHTRRVIWLAVPVYGLLALAGLVTLRAGADAWQLVALALLAGCVVVTATVAGPAHNRLAAGRDPAVLARLLVADRLRCAAAVLAGLAALVASA
jgi:hypothetical protein